MHPCRRPMLADFARRPMWADFSRRPMWADFKLGPGFGRALAAAFAAMACPGVKQRWSYQFPALSSSIIIGTQGRARFTS